MEEIEVCEEASEVAEEISAGHLFEMTGSDGRFSLMNGEPGGVLQVKTINSLRVLSKDPDIIVVKERQFKCKVQSCGQKFLSESSLLRHNKRCHSDSGPETTLESSVIAKGVSFACPVCSKIFSQQGNLKTHLRTHSNDLPFACNFSGCRRCFNSSESLKRHKLTHLGIKLFDCDICGRPCSSNLALKEHVARHVNLKPYSCDMCGRAFRQVSCYKRHLQTHNSQHRPFECDICHQAFSQTVYLKSHMKSHTGEKPFACGQCLKRFAHASDRNRHMSVHSDERKFACGLCGSRFTDPSSCRRHIHEHSSAKSNVCMVCDASFKRSFQLKHHMAKSHGIEPNTIPAISVCQNIPAGSFSCNLPPDVCRGGTKKWNVIDVCPSSPMGAGISRCVQREAQVTVGISRRVQREARVTVGISRPVQREAQVTVGISRHVQKEAPQVTMGISRPVQREVQVTMGTTRPLAKEAAVGISRHILETANGVVSFLVYPVHKQATETNHCLAEAQNFPSTQNTCQLERQIPSTIEPGLCLEIAEGAVYSCTAEISNVNPRQSNFSLAADLSESNHNFTSVKNFPDCGNLTGSVSRSLNNQSDLTRSILSSADGSTELSFIEKICFPNMTSNAITNPQVIRDATDASPLHGITSPVSEGKTETMELLSLCHDYAADQNHEISTALAPNKGFADMSLPYDDVFKMLAASDALDQLNGFENLHQDVCK